MGVHTMHLPCMESMGIDIFVEIRLMGGSWTQLYLPNNQLSLFVNMKKSHP